MPAAESNGVLARVEHIVIAVRSEFTRPLLAWFDWITLAAGVLIILIPRLKSWRERAGDRSNFVKRFGKFAVCLLLLVGGLYVVYVLNRPMEFVDSDIEFYRKGREDFDERYSTGQLTTATAQQNQTFKPEMNLGLKLAQGFLDFSVLILIILRILLTVGMRLTAPIVIALALNRKIRGMRLYLYGWGVLVFSVIWSGLSYLLCALASISSDLAMYIRESTPGGEVIAVIAIVFTGLLLLAIPRIFYGLAMGRTHQTALALVAAQIRWLASLSSQRRRAKL